MTLTKKQIADKIRAIIQPHSDGYYHILPEDFRFLLEQLDGEKVTK